MPSSSLSRSLRERLPRERRSGQPRDQQLRTVLRELIREGVAGPGEVLPAERELALLTGWSRVTVRKALAALVEEGVVNSKPGAGTYVGQRIVRSFSRLTSFTDDLRARGLDPRVKFLSREVGDATSDEAMVLALSPGSRVVRLHRLRSAGERPLAVERTIVPQDILPAAELVKGSLYGAPRYPRHVAATRAAAPARGRPGRGERHIPQNAPGNSGAAPRASRISRRRPASGVHVFGVSGRRLRFCLGVAPWLIYTYARHYSEAVGATLLLTRPTYEFSVTGNI